MIVADTNVLVRFIVNDDPEQSERAFRLFDENEVRIVETVMLETEWILRSYYKYPAQKVGDAFKMLLRMESVIWDDAVAIHTAALWHAAGMDFADALHLAQTRSEQSFATFDVGLAKLAQRHSVPQRLHLL
jgi:predicted nucleic-acid-binding protein